MSAILDRFFPGQYEKKSGSHIFVQDGILKGIPDYGPDGDFSIVIKEGQKVKGYYLRKLAETIYFLKGSEE